MSEPKVKKAADNEKRPETGTVRQPRTNNPALREASIHEQLLFVQQSLAAPKDLENEEKGFSYRSIEGILAAVKPLIGECGCTLTFTEDIRITDEGAYVVTIATLRNGRGEETSTTSFAREDRRLPGMCSAQISGSCISYARKYAAGGLFAIDNNKLAEPIDIDSLYPSLVEEVKQAEDQGCEVSAPSPEMPVNATRLPILRPGAINGWSAELEKVRAWEGTEEEYLQDLASRWITDEEARTLLLARRGKPFPQ